MDNDKPFLLVADDEDQIRELIEQALSGSFHVLAARDGQQAKDFFMQMSAHIQLVITDLQMPILDGVSLTHWLLDQAEAPAVIVMTGANAGAIAEAQELLADKSQVKWLEKPFPIRKLRKLVGECQKGKF